MFADDAKVFQEIVDTRDVQALQGDLDKLRLALIGAESMKLVV